MKYVVIIPARYQSSRLPGKPLVEICGIPMIVRTYRQCIKAVNAETIFVATDDERIRQLCDRNKIQVIMTSSHCLTGTDRIAEAATKVDADTYFNIQGDEPVFNPDDILKIIEAAREFPGEVLNGFCSISDESLYRSSSIPKVVMRPDGRLLYMSRASIPTNKKHGYEIAWRQVCAYAFPKAALKAFASQPHKTLLEKIEDIELLRFLELGWKVRMIPMSDASIAVDNPDDVAAVERVILSRGM